MLAQFPERIAKGQPSSLHPATCLISALQKWTGVNRRRWTSSEDHHLVAAYRHVPVQTIASVLGRTDTAVKLRVSYLGMTRHTRRWGASEDEFIRRRYGKVRTGTIAEAINRTTEAVYGRAWKLGLMRSTPRSKRRPWRLDEIEYLNTNYGNIRPSQISRNLRRSCGAIHHKAQKLGLFSASGSPEYVRRQSLPRTARPFTGLSNPIERGYVAGVLDGEGSIGPPPRIFISVTTTTKSLAFRLQTLAGGSVAGPYQYGKTKVFGSKRCRVKPQYHWNYASRYHAYLLLKAVQPYLVVKARAARRAIEYVEAVYRWEAE